MRLLRVILAGALGACAALVVACGDSNGLLARDDASSLSSRLDSVSAAVGAGHCAVAQQRAAALQDAVVNLPGTVDRRVLTDLQEGASTVARQAATGCREAAAKSTNTTTTETTTTQTQTVPTQTQTVPTQTVTVPTQTQTVPTQTLPATPTTPAPTTPTPTTPSGGGTGGGGTGTGGTGAGGAAPGQ